MTECHEERVALLLEHVAGLLEETPANVSRLQRMLDAYKQTTLDDYFSDNELRNEVRTEISRLRNEGADIDSQVRALWESPIVTDFKRSNGILRESKPATSEYLGVVLDKYQRDHLERSKPSYEQTEEKTPNYTTFLKAARPKKRRRGKA